MKRTVKLIGMAIVAMALGTQPANAQLGKLLKKAKQAVTSVTNAADQASVKADGGAVVKLENGGTMSYSLKDKVEFQLVGVYGTSTSENYGTIHVVLNVKMIANKSSMKFGGCGPNREIPKAIDTNGNAYDTKYKGNVSQERDVVEGTFVKIKLDDGCEFLNVKKSTTALQILKMPFWLGYEQAGVITIKDVPVQWDVETES